MIPGVMKETRGLILRSKPPMTDAGVVDILGAHRAFDDTRHAQQGPAKPHQYRLSGSQSVMLGVYLVSVSIGYERDLMGKRRPNRLLLTYLCAAT